MSLFIYLIIEPFGNNNKNIKIFQTVAVDENVVGDIIINPNSSQL